MKEQPLQPSAMDISQRKGINEGDVDSAARISIEGKVWTDVISAIFTFVPTVLSHITETLPAIVCEM